jgi:hypothetical protein
MFPHRYRGPGASYLSATEAHEPGFPDGEVMS